MISQVQGVHDFLSPCDMWLYVCICVWLVLLVTLKACDSQMQYVELWHCHELLFCESVFGGFVLQWVPRNGKTVKDALNSVVAWLQRRTKACH